MDLISNIPFFSIFLAMFAGIITPLIKDGKKAQMLHMIILVIIGSVSMILMLNLYHGGNNFTFMMGRFPAPWGNELRAGPLEALMATLFCSVMFFTIMGGQSNIFSDIVPEKQNLYFIMLNLLLGSMLALIYTNDLFTAYVFIEINTIASCALIMAKGTGESIVATIHYLIVSLLGSGLFLIGISLVYSITGHLLMPNIHQALFTLLQTGDYTIPFTAVLGLLVLGLAIKSALYPFHSMLYGAYSVAIPASCGILSGLVLKSYIFLVIKIFYCVFSIDIAHSFKITNVIFILGLAGMVMGSVHALRENKIKRMLAYSSVAQIGYIFMGLGLGTHVGVVAACYHILAHAITKAMLFVSAGALINTASKKEMIIHMRGVGHKNKLAAIAFTVGAFSMIGIPLFAGFVSKLYFATASLFSPGKMAATLFTLAVSMVLNAMYFLPSVIAIWAPPVKDSPEFEKITMTPGFCISMLAFISANIGLGIFYEPVIHIIEMGIMLL